MWRALERVRAEGPAGPSRRLNVVGESLWLTSAKLKLVDGCNLRCQMCDYWRGKRRGELATEEVAALFRDLRALGCEKVHLTGGELFLRRDVVELVEVAARLGMRTNMTTNGTLLSRDAIRALVRVPVRSVTLSVDSPVAKVHDRVRGRRDAWARTTRALDRLLAKRGRKTRVRVNTVVGAHNFRSLVEMPGFLRGRPVDGWLLIPVDPWTDTAALMSAADIAEYNSFIAPALADTVHVPGFDPWIFGRTDKDVEHGSCQQWARGYYREHRCRVPWFHVLVDSVGDVYPCCMGHRRLAALGNVREQSIAEIFSGPTYREFRRRLNRERTAVCHNCDDFLAENRAFDALEAEWTRE